MIKKFLCLLSTLCLAGALNAAITVIQDGQQPVKYKAGSVLSISEKARTVVNYDEVVITVPQNQNVQISPENNGRLIVSGTNLNRVQIGGSIISANGTISLVVDPKTQLVTVKKGGPAYITTGGKTSTVANGSSVKVDAIAREKIARSEAPVVAPYKPVTTSTKVSNQGTNTVEEDTPAFVAAEAALNTPDLAAQQAQNDLAAEAEVSPSAPTGN